MKRVLQILILLVLGYYPLMAQGNLQFNQVHTFGGQLLNSCYGGNYFCSQEYTVPNNKVWKIEARTLPAGGGFQFLINELAVDGFSDCVIWLKAGDVIKYRRSNTIYQTDYFLSVIEFNIVP